MSRSPGIRTESIEVRRTALVAMLGPEGPALAGVRELWYVLHGYSMRAAPFLEAFRKIAGDTRLLVAPEALSRFYHGTLSPGAHKAAPVVASWMTRDERDAEIADYLFYLDTLHAKVMSRFAGVTPRVTVLGFSQGGATAARWIAAGRVKAARLVVWGSALAPDLDLATPGSPLRSVETVFVVGSRDAYITPKIVAAELARMRAAQFPFRQVSYDGEHWLDDGVLRQLTSP
ncbi:MAG: alpha/beta hydrolase [Gemmatimonadales bacterium]